MKEDRSQLLSTRTLPLVAALHMHGYQPIRVDRYDRTSEFHYERTAEVTAIADDYYNDRLQVPARAFSSAMWVIKREFLPR